MPVKYLGIMKLDPYKQARAQGRADMRDEVLKVLSEAATFSSKEQADLLWDLIKITREIAMEEK